MGMRNAGPSNDSFADDTPIGADGVKETVQSSGVNEPQTEQVQPASMDTFDSPEMGNEEMEQKLEELKGDKGQVSKLDEEEVKEPDPKSSKDDGEKEVDKKEAKVDDDEHEADEQDKADNDQGTVKKAKTIRLKDGDEKHDISLEATVPVKIKGKKEFVSIKDLRDDFSGRKAWSEEIEGAKTKMEEAENLHQKTRTERDEITGHLSKIADMLDESEDPMAPLLYLVELSGRNVLDYTKKVYSHLSDTVHDLDDMGETERQLYWQGKELEFIKNNQATKAKNLESVNANKEHVAKVDQLRESHGVSEEQYVDSFKDLVSLGYKEEQLTPEVIVQYHQMVPHYEKSEGLCASFEEDLTTDQMIELVEAVARTSKDFPNSSDEKILQISAEKLGWDTENDDSDIEELNSKATGTKEAPTPTKYKYNSSENDGHIESFDDFDEGTYGRNYG